MRMRKILLMLAFALACFHAAAQDQFFKNYANVKGVTTVYISKSMLSLMPKITVGKKQLGQPSKKIDQLSILTCEQPSTAVSIATKAQAYYRRNSYEEMMQINDDGEKTIIYMKRHPKGRNEFVLLSQASDEMTIINVLGTLSLNDIRQFTQ